MQPAGKFRHIGKLQSKAETQDPSTGIITVTWADFETDVRADIRYLGGLETLKADVPVAIMRASIRIHYRTGVVPTMRFVEDGGQIFDIKNVSFDDTGVRYIDLACEAGANEG